MLRAGYEKTDNEILNQNKWNSRKIVDSMSFNAKTLHIGWIPVTYIFSAL